MENSQLQLKDLNEKNAKAIAMTATKFLKAQGINLQYAAALDFSGLLCGFADWQGLRAAIDQAEKAKASTPIKMRYADWLDKYKPIKNHLDAHAGSDGYGFGLGGSELEAVEAAFAKNRLTVWTLVETEGTSAITEGIHIVNRMCHFITRKPANAHRFYEIPYGHDEDDKCFEVVVLNRRTREEVFTETRYGYAPDEILEDMDVLLHDATEEIEEKGGTPVIFIKQLEQ